jgi:hypothetical protein
VQFLLCYGAAVDARDWEGRTALMLGASSGFARIVDILRQMNPNVNAKDNGGWTALTHAASGNHRGVVEALLATPNIVLAAKNHYGQTAGDLTTCPTLKGLLGVSGGVGLLAPPPAGAPDLKPPPVDSRSPKGPTLATSGPGPSSFPALMAARALPYCGPPAQVSRATANTCCFPPPRPCTREPAVETVARMGLVGRESPGAEKPRP